MPDHRLYEEDFHAWALGQAEALRRLAAARSNIDLDLEHLAEEVEDLGRSQRHAVEGHVERIIEHFLKLEHSPAPYPRALWKKTVAVQRAELARKVTPSLRAHLAATLAQRYRVARRLAALGLEEDAVDPALLPSDCPYTLDQIEQDDWLPENMHGLDR